MLKILIVVPAYNNASTISDIIRKAVKTRYDLLVVNDGSNDKTGEILKGKKVFRVDHSKNKGKGASIITGLKWAKEHGYSHIVTIDADGQHNPLEAVKFVGKIKENPFAVIVGSRDFSSANVPLKSRFGRKVSNFWLKVACGTTISDTQSGFRAYPVNETLKLKLKDTGYDFEIEVLAKAVWAGLTLDSVNISVHYSNITKAASHFAPIGDNIRISKTYARLILRNFIPVPHKMLFRKAQKKTKCFHT